MPIIINNSFDSPVHALGGYHRGRLDARRRGPKVAVAGVNPKRNLVSILDISDR